ncbi:CopG family transcriptional regulator [Alcaligenaceae bacterium CGII-47]|nr:CopG family transcriptional regulator [Alcaligenaceae bacterium CGII-47]
MKFWLAAIALAATSFLAQAADKAITVYQDPNCGCCSGWVEHMRNAGFEVKAIKTANMASIKQKLGVPMEMSSCHTGVVDDTGQIIEGHVPANVVRKLLADTSIRGVSAPGMPLNAPGMGELDGNLVTVDFSGKEFSRD